MSTAREMVDMLNAHYVAPNRPAGGLFAAEVGSPCGRRRADALWLPLTASHGKPGLVGHEIKVSRSDVMVELADPTKADPWLRYCRQWWLVVSDPALVEGLDIPESWGIMAPPSGRRKRSMTVLRSAPELHPMEPAVGVVRLLAWYFHRTVEREWETTRNGELKDRQIERLQHDVAELRQNGVRSTSPAEDRIRSIIHAVDAENRRDWTIRVKDEEIVSGILDHARVTAETRKLHDRMQSVVKQARGVLEAAADVAEKGASDLFLAGVDS